MPILTPEERVGTRLDGTYDLIRICGRGGMGTVYEAVHAWTGRRVAVKILHPGAGYSEESVPRFLREARTAAAIRHPNVVDVLDMGTDGPSPFLVMELLEGETLEALVAREGRLSPQRALELLLPVMGAIAVAHDAGIVHRDLKPANIFLDRGHGGAPSAKLCDFGIAKMAGGEDVTLDDRVVGTPSYMSPEHAQGHPVGREADVWGMGVVLYRCLSGKLPFGTGSALQVLTAMLAGRPTPLTALAPGLPPRLCAAVERALNADPSARYPDMRAFCQALVTTGRAAGLDVVTPPDTIAVSREPHEPAPAGPSTRPSTETAETDAPTPDVVTLSPTSHERSSARSRSRSRAAVVALGAAALGAALWLTRSPGSAGSTTPEPAARSVAPVAEVARRDPMDGPVAAAPPPASAANEPTPAPPAPPTVAVAPAATAAAPAARPGPGRAERKTAAPRSTPADLPPRGTAVPKIRTEW